MIFFIFIFVFLNFFSKELSENFLKKYYLSATKSKDFNVILDSNVTRNELKEDFFKNISNEKIFEEAFTIKDIEDVLNGYLDIRAAQVDANEIKIFEDEKLEGNITDLEKERLKNAFTAETNFFDIDDFLENENVVSSRVEFLEFLLSDEKKSKKFITETNKKLQRIKEIEKKIYELQQEMKVEIVESESLLKVPIVTFFPGFLKLIPTNLQPAITYMLDKGIFNIGNFIFDVKKNNPVMYLQGLEYAKNIFIIKAKADLIKLIFPLYIISYLGITAYENYFVVKKRFFVPKIFFEYSKLIREKNKIIKEIYESFLKISKKNNSFKFIPEVAILKKILNLESCKKIENDFYFGYYDRFVTTIKSYKILEFSTYLNEKYNFDISKIKMPTEIYPFNIYEKFLGFIEFSLFKANLIKESLKRDKNKYTIPNFYSFSKDKNDFCFEIKEVWHPNYKDFISNDINLGFEKKEKKNALVIAPTGTGKSTFLVQLLAMLIISRTGIVPAEIANINFPSCIFQNIYSFNGTVGSGLSKHMAERVFVKNVLAFAEKNEDKYFYLIADEICSGTTRSQTKEFVNEYLNSILSKTNLTSILTTHIEEVYENIKYENTNVFNIEVLRKGYEDFELTRKLKSGTGFWMEKNEYDAQNEFVRFLAKNL